MDCPTCGNPVDSTPCPYCGASVPLPSKLTPAPILAEINLKAGMPRVHEALDRFRAAFVRERARGVSVILVIHGYGSQGTGGNIKTAFREHCRQLADRHEIAYFVPGEDAKDAARKQLARQFPTLAAEGHFGRANPGITWLVLPKPTR